MQQKITYSFYFRISQGKSRAEQELGSITYTLKQGSTLICEKNAKIKCHRNEFDLDRQKFKGKRALELNLELGRVREKISKQISDFLRTGDYSIIKEGINFDKIDLRGRKSLIEVVQEYIEYQRPKIRKTGEKKHSGNIEATTFRTYEIRQNANLAQYLQSLQEIVTVRDVNISFLEKYNIWLTTTTTQQGKRRGQAYANKCVKFVKTVMKYATTNGHIQINQTETYKCKREGQKPVKTLDSRELYLLENYKEYTPTEQKVIDVFLFCKECFLHIGDYKELESKHFSQDKDGDWWITKDRKKSQEEGVQVQRIPITEKAKTIIKKYGSVEEMPHFSDNFFGRYLKIAAEKIGVKQGIYFKMARTSGISEAYNSKSLRGESIAVVAGWTTTRELKTYLKIDFNQLKTEFKRTVNF